MRKADFEAAAKIDRLIEGIESLKDVYLHGKGDCLLREYFESKSIGELLIRLREDDSFKRSFSEFLDNEIAINKEIFKKKYLKSCELW